MTTATIEDLREFIGYFEEPEPGVPEGFSGWYHSGGRFPLRLPDDAFGGSGARHRGPLKAGVSGPFSTREQALDDLARFVAE